MSGQTRAASAETTDTALSNITVGGRESSSGNSVAPSTTPPTSVEELPTTMPNSPATGRTPDESRSMRKRRSQPEYNVKKLAGTAVHTRRLYLGLKTRAEIEAEKQERKAEKLQTLALEAVAGDDDSLFDSDDDLNIGVQDNEQVDAKRPIDTDNEEDEHMEDSMIGSRKEGPRSLRERKSLPVYNDTVLAGNHVHIRRGFLSVEQLADRDAARAARRASAYSASPATGSKKRPIDDIDSENETAKNSPRKSLGAKSKQRRSMSAITGVPSMFSNAMSATSAKLKGAAKSAKDTLRLLKGKKRKASRKSHVDGSDSEEDERPKKKGRFSTTSALEEEEDEEEIPTEILPDVPLAQKQYKTHGMWAGQERGFDPRANPAKNKSKNTDTSRERTYLPLPMFTGERLLDPTKGDPRNFLLPYHILNRLNHGMPKDFKPSERSK